MRYFMFFLLGALAGGLVAHAFGFYQGWTRGRLTMEIELLQKFSEMVGARVRPGKGPTKMDEDATL